MGLCKCPKRKVTNLFCFEHDVNVCEDCLVSDHERCIVQSYVQWLQDSDYNPICILCKELLKENPTIRLACYDIFHWSCLDKYMSELPANTAPAGYQCPKCKSGIFPSPNVVSPVVDVLRQKLETVKWSRVGLGQSLNNTDETIKQIKAEESLNSHVTQNEQKDENVPLFTKPNSTNSHEDDSNGYVIINKQNQQKKQENLEPRNHAQNVNKSESVNKTNSEQINTIASTSSDQMPQYIPNSLSHNRTQISDSQINRNIESSYDPSLGVVLNINNLDRDTGEYKYQRRPVFEWLSRWLKSRQMSSRVRMTRAKKNLFIVILIFIVFFTLILIMTRLGNLNTEDDPAFDPLNNPNIHVE